MENRGHERWSQDLYSAEQVEAILTSLSIYIDGETESAFLAECPFHSNQDTPAFAVNKAEGTYICFNPACARSGNLTQLIKQAGKMNDMQAARLIAKTKLNKIDIVKQLESLVEPATDWKEYDPAYIKRVQADMWLYAAGQLYMRGRGFEKQTLKDFNIGYDIQTDMVCVPVHDPTGKIITGAVRRSIKGKRFKNTPGLPTSKMPFNLHNAKKESDTVIIVEASFDVMRLYQVGYRNAVACLGGIFNNNHAQLLGKYFNTIVIMTDYDKPIIYKNCTKCAGLCRGHNAGEDLGYKIASQMENKRVLWAHWGGATRFPPDAKDAGDMEDAEIRYAIKNAVSHIEYGYGII